MGNSPGIGFKKLPAGAGWQQKAPFKPLISVVTVVRNGELYLAQTINSVIEQTYKDIELIIIDGKSTDSTLDLIRKYEKSISCWISEPDDGIYDAMNKAIKICRGDYLYFLNCADRFVHPRTIEDVVNSLPREAPDIICGNVLEVHEAGTKLYRSEINSEYQLYLETICHQALFTAKRVFATVGTFDVNYRISADREWLLRALKMYNYKLFYIEVPVCVFDISGVSSRQRMRLRVENIKVNHKYFRWLFYPFLFKQFADKIKRILSSTH